VLYSFCGLYTYNQGFCHFTVDSKKELEDQNSVNKYIQRPTAADTDEVSASGLDAKATKK